MTNYFPHQNRKSLMESCLLNAMRDEYQNQEAIIKKQIADDSVTVTETPFAYETFDFKQADQNFLIGNSDLFSDTLLLFKKMHDIDPEFMYVDYHTSSRIQYKPRKDSFKNNHFDVAQIDGPFSYIDAVKFLHNLYISSPDLIYGALLHDGRKFINPLHPLIAQSFVKKASLESTLEHTISQASNAQYRIVLYTYKPSIINNDFLFNDDFKSLFTSQILSSVALLDCKSSKTFKAKRLVPMTSQHLNANRHDAYYFRNIQYEYEEVRVPGAASGEEINLQPVQLVNDGLASPYYGIVAQRYVPGSGSHGYNLSPMFSCNIGRHLTEVRTDGTVSVPGASVCTGNFSNTSLAGRLSLNHANLGSPFYNDIVGQGSYTYAQAAVRIAVGIYAEYLDLQRIDFLPEQAPKAPLSFEEFKRINPSATLKEYITGIKSI